MLWTAKHTHTGTALLKSKEQEGICPKLDRTPLYLLYSSFFEYDRNPIIWVVIFFFDCLYISGHFKTPRKII